MGQAALVLPRPGWAQVQHSFTCYQGPGVYPSVEADGPPMPITLRQLLPAHSMLVCEQWHVDGTSQMTACTVRHQL